MSSPQLFTIVDDSFNNSFVLGPRDWKSTNLPQWFNSTLQSPAFALDQGSPLGTVKMKFEGMFFVVGSIAMFIVVQALRLHFMEILHGVLVARRFASQSTGERLTIQLTRTQIPQATGSGINRRY